MRKPESIVLNDGLGEIEIVPERGAGLAAYRYFVSERPFDLFLPDPSGERLAAMVLMPWSNRIGNGGFTFGGRFISLAPNVPGERHPIHGNAFQQAWNLKTAGPTSLVLSLVSEGPGAFRYSAELTYRLDGGALDVGMRIVNLGPELPFGVGFHPWLPRSPDLEIQFSAACIWEETADHLPLREAPVASRPDLDFSNAAALPDSWVNNVFCGWQGKADIFWREAGIALGVGASPSLGCCIVYSPGAPADFFCFEPVSHPVDAHNMDDPIAQGLVRLKQGCALEAKASFTPRLIASGP